ncbi:TPA: hypothetical protein HA265_00125 [Candidatus Woesearchaeota archaeon]|nr:hypothetical protein [Candidatus Woesearchaeota archaeon]
MRDEIDSKSAKKVGISILGAIAAYFGLGGTEAKADPVGTGGRCLRLETIAKRTARGIPKSLASALYDLHHSRLELNSSAAILYKCDVARKGTGGTIDNKDSYMVLGLSGTNGNKVEVQFDGTVQRPDWMLKYHYTTPEYADIMNAISAANVRNGGKAISNAQIHYVMGANITYVAQKKGISMTYNPSDAVVLRELKREWVGSGRGRKLVIHTTDQDNGGRIIDVLYKKSAVPKGMDRAGGGSQTLQYKGSTYVHPTWENEAIIPYAVVTPITTTPTVPPRRAPPRHGGGDGGDGGTGRVTPPRPDPRTPGDDGSGGTGRVTPPRPDDRPRTRDGPRPDDRRRPADRPRDGGDGPSGWPPGPTPHGVAPKTESKDYRLELGLGIGAFTHEQMKFVPIGIIELGYEFWKNSTTLGVYGTFGGMNGSGDWTQTGTLDPNPMDPYQRYGDISGRSRYKMMVGSVGVYMKQRLTNWLRLKLGVGAAWDKTQTASDEKLQIRYPDGTPDGVPDQVDGSYQRGRMHWTPEGSAGLCFGGKRGEVCLEGRIRGPYEGSHKKVVPGAGITGTFRF